MESTSSFSAHISKDLVMRLLNLIKERAGETRGQGSAFCSTKPALTALGKTLEFPGPSLGIRISSLYLEDIEGI